ncbi:DEAD/DEAH box helicase family protein [Methanobacterium paludis]|uniref:Type III restriction protein res subunit n=1 Tax=Methanobacterium paludis (strain DSM 25820 / JCM 18151 / SWAN1) TaxID=868131 RepID=F6D1Q2_METPW|nr:DEAD/DEAH box helicase family protein [Methanobacterium paludis]AEG17855.1 type III restriction protein res subunit [Methanobacterium paludis]
MNEKNDFYREYNLIKARKNPSKINLAQYQRDAQTNLRNWFEEEKTGNKGGILVLPTGGGKTLTAVRFLCQGPLSKGYKVLWLAHTHHLLEQAYYSFGPHEIDQNKGFEIGFIEEPRENLNVRVVSGTKNHFNIQQIESTDDVLISTLQSVSSGYKRKQPHLMKFLESAEDKLFVVFDEAHQSPAPSYRNLILELRKQFSQMYLLGLTATPTYSDEKKKGWLKELFPQDIIYQVTLKDLMAQEILAEPIFEDPNTEFKPDFEKREYEKWIDTYSDLPKDIINQLADNRGRNQFIARAYAENKIKYGKTIIFADRWNQCVQLCEFLRKEGVKAGTMFSHVHQTGTGRVIGGGDENSKVLERFKNDELDVLINIRMLTEGTDVPDVKSVFLTRQTTSKILLTQMIGRALRGPKFGGTDLAYIVSFVDNWNQKINWAEWDPLDEGGTGGTIINPQKRPPLQLISIDLVRHLSRIMFQNKGLEIGPFLKNMPLGWYQTKFYTLSKNEDDYIEVNRLVMVFENEKESYEKFMDHLESLDLSDFESEEINVESKSDVLNEWVETFLDPENSYDDGLENNIFNIVCHIAQGKEKPPFFEFEDRKNHDMDQLARKYRSIQLFEVNDKLKLEFEREDRYWDTIYPNYDSFINQFYACVRRLNELTDGMPDDVYVNGESKNNELDNETKIEVKKRYPNCLSCGEKNKMLLEVDHVNPRYFGGKDSIDNLQTLCRYCNSTKNTMEIDFRNNTTPLKQAPEQLRYFNPPQSHNHEDETWNKYIKRIFNMFYCASAVKHSNMDSNGEWKVELYSGNDPKWIRPYLKGLTNEIIDNRRNLGLKGPEKIIVI